ncbi:MAG: hypothetical protein MHM6MM_002220 [Cercozoa sp. M6MM]
MSAQCYKLEIDMEWQQNPGLGNEHFSPPVVAVHDPNLAAYRVGEPASPGIKLMSETGAPGTLVDELKAINATVAAHK